VTVVATLYGSAPTADPVSREMSAAWRSFATNGDPGWAAYESGQQLTRVFDEESYTTRYPEQASQRIWSGYPFDPFCLRYAQ
jgi:para-nitrobenzyl esterase